MLSVLDIYRIGIGPSSSHTVGPMRIARRFLLGLDKAGMLERVARVEVILRGSLAFTGRGHATHTAAQLGLLGLTPEQLDPGRPEGVDAQAELDRIANTRRLRLLGARDIAFDSEADIVFDYDTAPELHPNEMALRAFDGAGARIRARTYYSTGGGFIASHRRLRTPAQNDRVSAGVSVPHPFGSAAELLAICAREELGIRDVLLANEDAFRPRKRTLARLDRIADAMLASIDRGLQTEGVLPGGLEVRRRAPELWRKLDERLSNERESLFDWLNAFAMAVNEENAAGGQVVTAPTNGAAGIIPAILRYYCEDDADKRRTLLLVAGGIGLLYKQRASISGAEMGCQGEVGVACSMAAGGLAAVWGGSPERIASAAEIGMEHNLGLTCDPVGGLVQIPCIERNAIGAVKAANAARLALHASGPAKVSLDQVIETMRQTGLDMSAKYKETSQGGLAVNVVEC